MGAFTPRTRRIRGAAILLVGGLAISGCASPGGDDAGSGGEADTLTVWFPGTNQTEIDLVTGTIVPAFEEETGAEVEVTFLDWSDLSTKLNAAFPAGTAPDVFGHGPAAIADFVVNDRIEELDPYLADLDADDVADFADALPGGQVDGVQYLMPLSMQGNMFVYDADDFRDAGLDPDDPPETWEEILAAAEKLTVRDGDTITRSGLLLASQPVGRQQTFANLLLSAGGDQVDGSQAAFNTPAGEEALAFFVETYAGDAPVGTSLGENYMDAAPAQQPIVTDTASIQMTVAPRATQILEAAPDLDLRVLPVPRFSSAKEPGALGGSGSGLMINKDSKAKDLAWRFISYMLSPEISEQYTQGIGAMPIRASALDSEYVQSSAIMQAWLEAGGHFTPNPNVAGWVQARDTMDVYLEQALHGQLSVEDALDRMEVAVNDVLESSAG